MLMHTRIQDCDTEFLLEMVVSHNRTLLVHTHRRGRGGLESS